MYERQTILKKRVIYSPMTGRSAPITEAGDQAFAEKMIGDGAMITPAEKTVAAPCGGTVLFVSGTKHAVGLETEEGIGPLLHVGIDTAALNGEGFNVWVEKGQTVKKVISSWNSTLTSLKKRQIHEFFHHRDGYRQLKNRDRPHRVR